MEGEKELLFSVKVKNCIQTVDGSSWFGRGSLSTFYRTSGFDLSHAVLSLSSKTYLTLPVFCKNSADESRETVSKHFIQSFAGTVPNSAGWVGVQNEKVVVQLHIKTTFLLFK